jgi:hypothetical protein
MTEQIESILALSSIGKSRELESEPLKEEVFLWLIQNGDKETHIPISKNPHITKAVALALVDTVAMALINLYNGDFQAVDEEVRMRLKERFDALPSLYKWHIDYLREKQVRNF